MAHANTSARAVVLMPLVLLVLLVTLGWVMAFGPGPAVPVSASPDGSTVRLAHAVVQGDRVDLPWRQPPGFAGSAGPRALSVTLPLDEAHPMSGPLGVCLNRASGLLRVSQQGVPLEMADAGAGLDPRVRWRGASVVALPAPPPVGVAPLDLHYAAHTGVPRSLGAAIVGPLAEVQAACLDLNSKRRAQALLAAAAVLAIAVTALTMAFVLREGAPVWLLGFCAAWLLHAGITHFDWIPVPADQWAAAFYASRTLSVPLVVLACHFLVRQPVSSGVRGVIATWPLGLVLLLLSPTPQVLPLWLVVTCFMTLMLGLHGMRLMYQAWRRDRLVAYALMAACFAAKLLSGSVELLRWAGVLGDGDRYLQFLPIPLLLIAFVVLLMERIHRLKQRTDQAHVEAAEQVSQARERLLQDLHDGLGSQLVAASVLLKSSTQGRDQAAAILVDGALQDLRNVLDVMVQQDEPQDPGAVTLLLAQLRLRMMPAFEQAGAVLEWSADELPTAFLARPSQRLALLRIAQEGLANALKHSGATRVQLALVRHGGGAVLSIEDNGCGPARSAEGAAGLGSTTLRKRALSLNAELVVRTAAQGGTRLELRWATLQAPSQTEAPADRSPTAGA